MEFRQSVAQSDVSSTASTSSGSLYIDPSTQLLSDEWRRKANLMTMKEIVAALDPDSFGDDIFSDPTRAVPALPLPAFSLASPPPVKAPWASVTHSNVGSISDARSYFTMSEPSAPQLHIATDFSPSPPASLPVSPAPAASRPEAWPSSGAPRPILLRAAVGAQQAKVNADLEGLAEHLKLVSSAVSDAVVNSAPPAGINSFVARRHVVHEVPHTPAAAAAEPKHQFKSEEEMLLASMPAPPPGGRPYSYRAARVVGTMGWLPTSDPRLPEAPKAIPHNAVYDVNIANRLSNWRTGGNQNSGAYVSVSRSDRFEEVRAGSKDVPIITPRTIDKHVHTRILHEIVSAAKPPSPVFDTTDGLAASLPLDQDDIHAEVVGEKYRLRSKIRPAFGSTDRGHATKSIAAHPVKMLHEQSVKKTVESLGPGTFNVPQFPARVSAAQAARGSATFGASTSSRSDTQTIVQSAPGPGTFNVPRFAEFPQPAVGGEPDAPVFMIDGARPGRYSHVSSSAFGSTTLARGADTDVSLSAAGNAPWRKAARRLMLMYQIRFNNGGAPISHHKFELGIDFESYSPTDGQKFEWPSRPPLPLSAHLFSTGVAKVPVRIQDTEVSIDHDDTYKGAWRQAADRQWQMHTQCGDHRLAALMAALCQRREARKKAVESEERAQKAKQMQSLKRQRRREKKLLKQMHGSLAASHAEAGAIHFKNGDSGSDSDDSVFRRGVGALLKRSNMRYELSQSESSDDDRSESAKRSMFQAPDDSSDEEHASKLRKISQVSSSGVGRVASQSVSHQLYTSRRSHTRQQHHVGGALRASAMGAEGARSATALRMHELDNVARALEYQQLFSHNSAHLDRVRQLAAQRSAAAAEAARNLTVEIRRYHSPPRRSAMFGGTSEEIDPRIVLQEQRTRQQVWLTVCALALRANKMRSVVTEASLARRMSGMQLGHVIMLTSLLRRWARDWRRRRIDRCARCIQRAMRMWYNGRVLRRRQQAVTVITQFVRARQPGRISYSIQRLLAAVRLVQRFWRRRAVVIRRARMAWLSYQFESECEQLGKIGRALVQAEIQQQQQATMQARLSGRRRSIVAASMGLPTLAPPPRKRALVRISDQKRIAPLSFNPSLLTGNGSSDTSRSSVSLKSPRAVNKNVAMVTNRSATSGVVSLSSLGNDWTAAPFPFHSLSDKLSLFADFVDYRVPDEQRKAIVLSAYLGIKLEMRRQNLRLAFGLVRSGSTKSSWLSIAKAVPAAQWVPRGLLLYRDTE